MGQLPLGIEFIVPHGWMLFATLRQSQTLFPASIKFKYIGVIPLKPILKQRNLLQHKFDHPDFAMTIPTSRPKQ
jgi:hypothetical protein